MTIRSHRTELRAALAPTDVPSPSIDRLLREYFAPPSKQQAQVIDLPSRRGR